LKDLHTKGQGNLGKVKSRKILDLDFDPGQGQVKVKKVKVKVKNYLDLDVQLDVYQSMESTMIK
jgi:hypothetical protein